MIYVIYDFNKTKLTAEKYRQFIGIVSRKIIADCYIDDLGYPARDEAEIIDMWKRIDAVADACISIYGTKELEQNKEQQNG